MDQDPLGKSVPVNATLDEEHKQAWSYRSGVIVASPTQVPTEPSPWDFDLNSVNKDGHKTLPGFQVSTDRGTTSNYSNVNAGPLVSINDCPCGPDCDQPCCKVAKQRSAPMTIHSRQLRDDTPLLSPVQEAGKQRCTSPAGSYGSTDSMDQLIDGNDTALRFQSPSGGPAFVVQDRGYDSESGLEASVRCGCHVKVEDKTSRRANTKLVIASLIALFFMIGEVLGGYFAGSLAIMTDAAHMLSDLAGFLISLFAIWVGSRPPSKRMSFGWHRAEVVGAIISVLIVWVLTGVLFYEAILRVINPDLIDVKADIMLATACVGVFVNVFMCAVLGHGHGHSHGGDGHGHSHGGHGHSHNKKKQISEEEGGDSHLARLKRRLRRKKKQESSENINVRAAFVHVIGDLIQSIGVVIAGYIIWFRPDWKIADPICTFLFCVLVLFSTLNVLKDALRVLMEGTPKHLNYEDVKADLEEIPGVKQAHSLHIWSLTTTRTALAAHLAIDPETNGQQVLEKASKMLKEKHNIIHSTLQVEEYHELMDDCGTCQEVKKKSMFWPIC